MPFKSEAQRRYLWSQRPDIAHRWAHEGPNTGLPERVMKRHKKRVDKRRRKR